MSPCAPDGTRTRVMPANLTEDLGDIECLANDHQSNIGATRKVSSDEIIPIEDEKLFHGRPCESSGITRVLGATSRLGAALGITVAAQPHVTEACLFPSADLSEVSASAHPRPQASSMSQAPGSPMNSLVVSDGDNDTARQRRLASPFRGVHDQGGCSRILIDLTGDDELETPIGLMCKF